MLVIFVIFWRVKELWMLDLRLGTPVGDFEALSEDEYEELMFKKAEE